MMVIRNRRLARIPFAPVAALMFGAAAAIIVAAAPVPVFERGVMATGIPQLLQIATPPLGMKARILGIALAFFTVAAILWVVIRPIERWLERDRKRRAPWTDGGYAKANDAASQVDAPRRPIFAPDELGAPLMSDEALNSVLPPLELSPDLEAPITEEELMPIPVRAAEIVPEIAEVAAPEPVAPVAEPWVPTTSPTGETSIHALIRRLEEGLARRGGTDPDPGSSVSAPPASEWLNKFAETAPRQRSDDDLGSAFSQLRRLAFR